MARRKAYRGTEAEHTADAIDRARSMKNMVERAGRMVKVGYCYEALQQIVHASNVQGRYAAARQYSRKQSSVLPRGGYSGLNRVLEAFEKKCLR
jgi:hypothetical protein